MFVEGNTEGLTHGMSKTPEYGAWQGMKHRCQNKNNKRYNSYGGRGIKVCNRWLDSFENFLADMELKPSKIHSIDRIDNDGDYTPENCRWATPKQQMANRRETSEYYIASPSARNKTGISGVSFDAKKNRFIASFKQKKVSTLAGFFEACCIRKSAEAKFNKTT